MSIHLPLPQPHPSVIHPSRDHRSTLNAQPVLVIGTHRAGGHAGDVLIQNRGQQTFLHRQRIGPFGFLIYALREGHRGLDRCWEPAALLRDSGIGRICPLVLVCLSLR